MPNLSEVGSALTPTWAFNSEQSLGWYRSVASTMALSYGSLSLPGFLDVNGSGVWVTGTPPSPAADTSSSGARLYVRGGSNGGANTTNVFIGFYRSSSQQGIMGFDTDTGTVIAGRTKALTDMVFGISGANRVIINTAGDLHAAGGLMSASTVSGTIVVATSGLSVGNATSGGGSLIPAISSISSLVAAFVVQPSASSFTIITWAAVKAGDQILTTVMQSGAVSSLSSGLVLHSHCTQNGQIEFRLSNVSTLVQNQSSRTYFFTRITPF